MMDAFEILTIYPNPFDDKIQKLQIFLKLKKQIYLV